MGGALAPSSSAVDTLPTLNVTLTGKSISVSGAETSGAVKVLANNTSKRDSNPSLFRLYPGVSFAQAYNTVRSHGGDPNYLDGLAAIVYDADAPKGTSSGNTVLAAGNYVAIDTQGNNPAKWPRTEFSVTQSSSPATLPKPKATVSAIDFGFTSPRTLHNGELVQFQNAGFLVHMIVAIKVKDVASANRLSALFLAGKDNQAQRLATGFVSFAGPLSSGSIQQEVVKASPGTYVLACFMSTQDGREHTQLGMLKTIRIAK
jgi:hypothetical protein